MRTESSSGPSTPGMELPEFSIIIPVMAAEDAFPHALTGISRLHYPEPLVEVLIVDSRRGGAEANIPRAFPFHHRILKSPGGKRASAINYGIEHSLRTRILILDGTVIPETDLLLEHAAACRDYTSGVIMGEIDAGQGTGPLEQACIENLRGTRTWDGAISSGLITCNISLNRKEIITAGLFSDEADCALCMDYETGFRLRGSGRVRFLHNPKARAWFCGRMTKTEAVRHFFRSGIHFARFIMKHPAALLRSPAERPDRRIRSRLNDALTFRPLTVPELRRRLSRLERYERAYACEPGELNERRLREEYRFIGEYSFREGAFSALRGLGEEAEPLFASRPPETGETAHLGHSLIWQGPIEHNSGPGTVARLYLGALGRLRYRIHAVEIDSPAHKAVLDCRHHFFVYHHRNPPCRIPTGPYCIQVTACETTRIPGWLVEAYNRMDEIWVPSEFSRQALQESGVRVPVFVIPCGIDLSTFRPRRLQADYLITDRFCFMSVGSFSAHKGFDILLQAYHEEFTAADQVVLVLKVSPGAPASHLSEREKALRLLEDIRVKTAKGPHPPVMFYYHEIPHGEFADFLNIGDAYVCASRGEGFAIPVLEAMSLGKIIISTGSGGQMQYLSDRTAYLVDYTLAKARSYSQPLHNEGLWAEASIEQMRHAMRAVYEKKEEALVKAAAARAAVRGEFNSKVMGRRIKERLDRIYQESGSAREAIFMEKSSLSGETPSHRKERSS